jgi:hypothetical protein
MKHRRTGAALAAILLVSLSAGRGEEVPDGAQGARRQAGAEGPGQSLLQNILGEALSAAQRGDAESLAKYERALSLLNAAIFRLYQVDVQRKVDRASAEDDPRAMTQAVTIQVLLTMRLLLRDSYDLTGDEEMLPRVRQVLFNYQLIEKPLAQMDPGKAERIRDVFDKLRSSVREEEPQRVTPLLRETDRALASIKLPREASPS